MSYDVYIMKFAQEYASPVDIPDDAETLPLGLAQDVQKAIDQMFPNIEWQGDGWGLWENAADSIEFNVGDGDSLALHIRASDDVMPGVVALCRNNGWRAIDGGDDFVESRDLPATNLSAWRAYRDQIR